MITRQRLYGEKKRKSPWPSTGQVVLNNSGLQESYRSIANTHGKQTMVYKCISKIWEKNKILFFY